MEKKRQHSFHLLSREFEKITESLSCGKGCDDEASDEADKRRCCLLQLGYIMAPLTYACPNLISSGLGEDECLEDYYEACEGAVAECYGLHSECWPSEFGEKVAELKKKIPTGLEIPIGHERRQRGQEI